MQHRYSIIDNNKSTIKKIQNFFEIKDDFVCVGASDCYNQSLDTILEYTPDIVFINVDDNHDICNNAFTFVNELYKYVSEIPHIIALSATKDEAYNCMKNNFYDYILKPINDFELRKSIARLKLKPKQPSNKLCLKSYKDYRFIEMDEILFLKADNTSTDFFMNDGNTISAYKTLKFFESVLPENFTRIHNSYIVNQKYVSRIHFGKSKCTIKQSSFAIPFSKSYKENVVILEKSISKNALLSLN
ncbi:LytTR family transcriptional regulator DNA-binding domain-containing protein [Aureibaculum sp. 2210JD6-5]|uniref:LytR/AlgR family response regulator transcription factor n=1 Tax=Aureibaculum sp. 2210JD6-5 TaxID=3103957 RepID=UPI002AACF18E|nr:LytTR family transcriptional regulator DNA-binding domain-containing protein [Aureibaculum sp. 2210JD6-5]MDY7394351.1 LytTR family transcriptional regulator DNA-binding domain-containing protein [Aureibaculum sp. 2210JD6-5]